MKRVFLSVALFLTASLLMGQSRPFPQNVTYRNGYKTSVISTTVLRNTYNRWKDLLLKSYQGMYRVCHEDTAITISEGMGYGMLLTAYFGEKEIFDGLLEFYKSKRTEQAFNLMAWRVTRDGILDPGSATDGDLDAAFALIVAHCQWGGNYLDEAKAILSILKDHYFVDCGGVLTMKPGGGFGGCDLTDLSYYTPGYFRVFADITGDSFWETVADHTYILLENGANDTTGLVPDWQTSDGVPRGGPNGGTNDYYRYDACRTPWRMSLDYLWNGNTTAQDWCVKITNFANAVGPANIVDGYDLDGTPRGQYNNSAFVGGFAVGAMCNSQAIVNGFSQRLVTLNNAGYDNQYFNLSLRCLYMLVLTGNFWQPEISDAYLGQTPPSSIPVQFAPDIIKGYVHGRIAVSPKGDEIFWAVKPSTERILYSKCENGIWSSPAVADFVKDYLSMFNGDPVFSPDGNKLFFYSNREGGLGNFDVWYSEKTENGWSEAVNVGEPYNTSEFDPSPIFTNDEKAYRFDYNNHNLCYTYSNDSFTNPESVEALPDYSPWWSIYISPEEDYLIFAGDPDNADLFIRLRNEEGKWGEPINMGDKINMTAYWERYPVVSPDGKYLLFIRGNSSIGNLYWVSTGIIDSIKSSDTAIEEEKTGLSHDFILNQNYPNPFNPTTTIGYSLSQASRIKVSIYNLNGQIIKTLVDQQQVPGNYTVMWDATDDKNHPIGSGMYFYKLETNELSFQKKMILIR